MSGSSRVDISPGSLESSLGSSTWVQLESGRDGRVLVVPIGSVEQHGPHLPLDTDTRIACEIADRLAAVLSSEAVMSVAPALCYGASDEHSEFPGTLSIGSRALRDVSVELVRSAHRWSDGVILLSGHGGNAGALEEAVGQCRDEGHRVLLVGSGLAEGDAHAGRTETSVMLAIEPCAVRLDAAEPGRTEALGSLLPSLRALGVRAVSPNGVLGDPTGATASEGKELLATAVDRLAEQVRGWRIGN